MTSREALGKLLEKDREASLVANIEAVLGWDQETYMPDGAVNGRAEQLAFLAGLSHQKNTDPVIPFLLEKAEADTSDFTEWERAFVKVRRRDYQLMSKLPEELVKELTKATSLGQQAWAKARSNNDFKAFAPHLENILSLTLKKAEFLGYEDHPYDALLDTYEPGMKAKEIKKIFDQVKQGIVSLLNQIKDKPQVDDRVVKLTYPHYKQELFGREVLRDLNYDMERGRLDISTHPFTTSLGPDDIRITTRYEENFFNSGIFGTIHEAGHGLYEQGMADQIKGTCLADGTSLGIHESQSRFWENMVGRSQAFWDAYLPEMQKLFPDNMKDQGSNSLFRAFNLVEPSLIRVEADEVTYNLHIILRFEIEMGLLSGEIKVADLPRVWNEKMEELLGIIPDSDTMGVLQDVHWSFGLMGYFPTYALGNLYSAQFKRSMEKDLGPLYTYIQDKNFKPLLDWFRDKVHKYGRAKSAEEICTSATGESLNPQYFLDYIKEKYGEIYNL